MDLVCGDAVEEILLRLPLKYLHHLRAVSRCYNALVLRPGFATRYWRSHGPHLSGVFLQFEWLVRPWGHRPCFLAAPGRRRSESVLTSDLGFVPQMHTCPTGGFCAGHDERMIFIVHSACGLLLCCRGDKRPQHGLSTTMCGTSPYRAVFHASGFVQVNCCFALVLCPVRS